MNKKLLNAIAEGLDTHSGQVIKEMVHLVDEGNCPICGTAGPFKFKDELSRKEFMISGICQKCQDKYFKEVE